MKREEEKGGSRGWGKEERGGLRGRRRKEGNRHWGKKGKVRRGRRVLRGV